MTTETTTTTATPAPAATTAATPAATPTLGEGFATDIAKAGDTTTPTDAQTPTEQPTEAKPGEKLYAGKYKSVDDLEKAYTEAQKVIGKGTPKPPEQYETKVLEEIGVNHWRNDEHKTETLGALKGAGLSQDQFNKLAPIYKTSVEGAIRDYITAHFGEPPTTEGFQKEQASLKAEWGDDTEARLATVNRVWKELPPRLQAVAKWDASVIKYIYENATAGRGPELIRETAPINSQGLQAKLAEIQGNPDYYAPTPQGKNLQREASEIAKRLASSRKR